VRPAPTRLRVIDLVPQHDIQPDGQLARHRHLGRRRPSRAQSSASGVNR
jgi:hypothetical protein